MIKNKRKWRILMRLQAKISLSISVGNTKFSTTIVNIRKLMLIHTSRDAEAGDL